LKIKAKPQIVCTDNGKEFIGEKKGQYEYVCDQETIVHQRGPVYTPQPQGKAERMNRTIKRLLWKLLSNLDLPRYCGKWLFNGVIDALNECVCSATGMSPDSFVFGSEAARSISLISVGDRVMVTDPRPLPSSGLPVHGKEGIFCGVESESCVMVIVKTENGRGWKPLRVHPSGVSLIEWYGLNASPDLAEFRGTAAAPTNDVDRFSDFSFDDDGEVDTNGMGGADPVAVLSSSRVQATFFNSVSAAAVCQLEHVVGS